MKSILGKISKIFVSKDCQTDEFKEEGFLPLIKSLPLSFQHVTALFISNISPLLIVFGSINDNTINQAQILQNAMLISGIALLLQLYGIWRFGSHLPLISGVNISFLSLMIYIGTEKGYGTALGSIIVGGVIISILGFFGKFWKRLISPLVAGIVVVSIGLALLQTGANSFAGGEGNADYASWQNILVASISLITCIICQFYCKGMIKNISILVGLLVGYVLSICIGIVDFGVLSNVKFISLPQVVDLSIIKFDWNAVLSFLILYIVGTSDSIGCIHALKHTVYHREFNDKVIGASISANGLMCALSGFFGSMPITPFASNVAIISNNKVVNKSVYLITAIIMILIAFFPFVGTFLITIPTSVLGGCTILLFASILITGLSMISDCGFSQRNVLILSLTFGIGFGFTLTNIFGNANEIVRIIGSNIVIMMFAVSLLLDLVLPKIKKA